METIEVLKKIEERLANFESMMSRFSQIDYFIDELTDHVSKLNKSFRDQLESMSKPVYIDSGSVINHEARPHMEFDSGNWLTGKYYRFKDDSKILTYNDYRYDTRLRDDVIFLDPPFWVPYCENHERFVFWVDLVKLIDLYEKEIDKLYRKYLYFVGVFDLEPRHNQWALSLESLVNVTKAKYFKIFP